MKMRKDHFETLKKHVLETLEKYPNAKQEYADAEYSPKRFRWDALHATRINGERSCKWICSNLYYYLNDDHIDTALRRIVK